MIPASKSLFFFSTGELSKVHLHFCGAGCSACNHWAKIFLHRETGAVGVSPMDLCPTTALPKLGEASVRGELADAGTSLGQAVCTAFVLWCCWAPAAPINVGKFHNCKSNIREPAVSVFHLDMPCAGQDTEPQHLQQCFIHLGRVEVGMDQKGWQENGTNQSLTSPGSGGCLLWRHLPFWPSFLSMGFSPQSPSPHLHTCCRTRQFYQCYKFN